MILQSVYLTIIFYWMIFLTGLVFLAPLESSASYFFIGILCVWLIFCGVLSGFLEGSKKNRNKVVFRSRPSFFYKLAYHYKGIFLTFAVSFLLSQYTLNFYTGQTIASLISNLMSGESLYALYQTYFMENDLAKFTFAKIPAILSLLIMKLIVLWSFFIYHFQPKIIKKRYYIFLMLICMNYLMFSFARGTNFELFEMVIIFIFSLVLRFKYKNATFSITAVIILLCALFVVISLYLSTVSARFGDEGLWACSVDLICLDTNSFLYTVIPSFAVFLFMISGYFLFGLLYISVFVDSFLYDMGILSIASFPPKGFDVLDIDITREAICTNYLDCGSSWTPSIILWISAFGVLVTVALLVLIGYIAVLAEKRFLRYGFLSFILVYYLMLLIMSLPVGNFVFTSSSNMLIFLISLLFFMMKCFSIRRNQ